MAVEVRMPDTDTAPEKAAVAADTPCVTVTPPTPVTVRLEVIVLMLG